jgi:hypothetical protein
VVGGVLGALGSMLGSVLGALGSMLGGVLGSVRGSILAGGTVTCSGPSVFGCASSSRCLMWNG